MGARAHTLSRNEQVLLECEDFIADNYADPELDVSSFVNQVGYSRRTVQRALQQQGVTWRDLICSYRMRMAQKLLKTTTLSTNEIAQRVGYVRVSSLNQRFREYSGTTPAQYRREHQSGAR